jgi:hypothetical protein
VWKLVETCPTGCARNPQQQLQAQVWFALLLLAIAESKIALVMMMSAVNLWKAQQPPRTQSIVTISYCAYPVFELAKVWRHTR